MTEKSFKRLKTAIIERVYQENIRFEEARTSPNTSHSKSVKGSVHFTVNITGFYDDSGEPFSYKVPVIFVGRARDYFVSNLFSIPDESPLWQENDALIAYLQKRGGNTVEESHIQPIRLQQIKDKIVEFFGNQSNWSKPKTFVEIQYPNMGTISFRTVQAIAGVGA